jgi:hypothetical protein
VLSLFPSHFSQQQRTTKKETEGEKVQRVEEREQQQQLCPALQKKKHKRDKTLF